MSARWRVKPVASGAATPPVTDVSLSASTVTDTATAGTVVGTLSNNLGISVSWTITDNSKFQLSASTGTTVTLQRSGTGSVTAGVNETVTIQATRSGTAPYEEAFSISVTAGGETLLGYLTMTNATAGAGTDVPFQIMWPTAAGDIGVGQALNVYDDDGSGGQGARLANFQVDNLSTDMNGDERLYGLSGIVPSITGSGGAKPTRKLWVYASATAVPSGTSITESDLFATSWRNVVSFDIGGTTYSVDTDDLNGASTTWSKTAPVRHDDWMDGPCRRCFVYSSPPFNGATPHASGDGLRVWFHIYVTKADTAAVSGGNPILTVECDIVLRNMDAVRVSPANYWYGFQVQRATSLSDGTLITSDYTDFDGNVTRYVYARSSPAVTLTATGATSTGAKTWTRASGSWDSDILGAHIKLPAGNGGAYVTSRTNNTTIEVYVYQAFGATSYTSGNWVVEGVGHSYGATWTLTTVVGQAPITQVLWGDNTSAVTPTTIAGLNFLSEKYAMNNYAFAFSDVTLDMTNLNLMRADSAIRPFTQRGPEGTEMGDVETGIGGAGDRDDIGQNAAWAINGVAKATGDGRRKMFENSLYYHSAIYLGTRRYSGSPTNGSLGVVMRPDCGTQYAYDTRWGTTIALPTLIWSPYDGNVAHAPQPHYIPYLYTAKLIYLERMQETAFYDVTSTSDPAYQGSGINQTPFGDASESIRGDTPWGLIEQRHLAWAFRDLCYATFCTPDASKPTIYNAKSCYTTWMENTWSRGAFIQATYTNGSGVEDYYDTDGPRFTGYRFNNNVDWSPWQTRYGDWAMVTAVELGLVTGDTQSFLEWMAVGYVGMSQSPDVAPDYTTTGYEFARCSVDGTQGKIDEVRSWADSYQAWMAWPYDYEGSPFRAFSPSSTYPRRPSTIALSAVSGSAITVTMTGGPFGQTSWYAGNGGTIPGGWIWESHGGAGKGQIQSVANSNSCIISTTVSGGATFTTTSPTASAVLLPIPHPLDAGADGSVTSGRDGVYMQLYRLGGVMFADIGVSTAACVSYITGLSNFPAIQNKLNIDSR